MIVPIEELRKLFTYDPVTGILVAAQSFPNRPSGMIITCNRVRVAGKLQKLSRICFAHYNGYWPQKLVDHINRNPLDNRASNLREVSHTQNQYNKVSPNPHGYKGVTWRDRKANPWIAKIRVAGQRINLGSFPTKEQAAAAYEAACLKYHGEYAQLGVL